MFLHLVTWNLHGTPREAAMDKRIARIAELLLARDLDLILLQEVWFEGDAQLLTEALASKYVRVRDAPAVTRHLGWVIGFRKGGLLAFRNRTSRWEVSETALFETFKARAPMWRIWQGDGISGKGVQRFDLQQSGHRIIVLNTHLQSPYLKFEDLFGREDLYPGVRRDQIDELAAYVPKEDARGSMLVAGDFNTAPKETDLYTRITSTWTDLTAKYHQECNCGTILDKNGPRKEWIDYLLSITSEGTKVRVERMRLIKSISVDCPYSDHYGLEAQLWMPLTAP